MKLKDLKKFINNLPEELDERDIMFYEHETEVYRDLNYLVEETDSDLCFQQADKRFADQSVVKSTMRIE